jgi:hypothetical protein
MNRKLLALVLGVMLYVPAVAHAGVYSNVYWVGGSGEWTGDVTASPEYATGHWSADPNAATGLPAKYVLGRNDGIRTNQAIGNGGYDLDRVPCGGTFACDATHGAGTQLGTDIYITGPVTVTYNPNNQFLSGDDGLDRFGDFRFSSDVNFPGTPTLNLSNGAIVDSKTTFGGDADGMWSRLDMAELNVDNATFRRTGDRPNGFVGGAGIFSSFNEHANNVKTISLTNGGRIENDGQWWFGVSGSNAAGENPANTRAVMTINNGHLDLRGGDAYELDNDNLPLRADLAFIYDWKADTDPTNDEFFAINFTGPGDITVQGDEAAPFDGDTSTGGGGIRVATNTAVSGPSNYGTDKDIQRSYQDLWNMGILRANNKSGLTGDNFNTYFTTTNLPGQANYKLTSLLASPPPSLKSRGDFNNDGKVDGADYVIWRKTLGSTTNLQADANGSLNIDAADYIHWRDNFGAPPGSGSGLLGAVPEPGTTMLMLIGLTSLWVFKRR